MCCYGMKLNLGEMSRGIVEGREAMARSQQPPATIADMHACSTTV